MNFAKAPFPWFGGKSQAADVVWAALGDVAHYVEPFAGSLAVLLNRPHTINRGTYSETVNDADGLLVNAWRSIQMSPEETADHASWPVSEADLMARHLALLAWRHEKQLEHMMADPCFHDPMMAGWWLNGICQWIGGGWCDGSGAWVVGADGRVTKRDDDTPGAGRQRPQLSDDGRGVNRPIMREGTPGVSRRRPHLSCAGQGVNRPSMREGTPGNVRNGASIWHPSAPDLTSTGLVEWFQHLAQRLRWVRIVNGDWARVCTSGSTQTLTVRMSDGVAGIFLDPPYADTADRDGRLYTVDSLDVAHAVREWALANGGNPKYRIVLACFEAEHDHDAMERAGWTIKEWFKPGCLSGGMGNLKKDGTHQQHRERLWLSPHCLRIDASRDHMPLFDGMDDDDI